jgi:hypothetical protein
MSDEKENRSADGCTSKRPRDGNYEVGYGKPPVAHRFKHGNQANPKGRRKGSRNRKLVIQEILFEPVTVRENGQTKRMPGLEALLKSILGKGLRGDHKSALAIIGLAQREGLLTPEQEQAVESLPDSDLAILDDARRRFGASATEDRTAPPVGCTPDEPDGTAGTDHPDGTNSDTSAGQKP